MCFNKIFVNKKYLLQNSKNYSECYLIANYIKDDTTESDEDDDDTD